MSVMVPDSSVVGASPAPPAPKVLGWYRAYAAAMALLYLGLDVGLVLAMVTGGIELTEVPVMVFGALMLVLCLALFALFAAALVLPPRPWVWIYHLVLITVGMTSACCLPACVALLVFWIKPEARAYFGRG
ncbi:MAG TPA: hypothetical protein VJU18_16025 [Vicinamibacteria bacterium]|nr:hypothetical protein [Vicinamibacteria bacterium]